LTQTQPDTMAPAERIAVVEAMVEQLEPLLDGDWLHRPVVVEYGKNKFHAALTLAALLQHLELLEAAELNLEERANLDDVLADLDTVRSRRREAYIKRLAREIRSNQNIASAAREEAADLNDDAGSGTARPLAHIGRLRDEARAIGAAEEVAQAVSG